MPSIRNPYFPALANTWKQPQNFSYVNVGSVNMTGSGAGNTPPGFHRDSDGNLYIEALNGNFFIRPNQATNDNMWQLQPNGIMLIYNSAGNSWLQTGATPSASQPTIASGTIYQNTTYSYQTIDIPCYASTAGTAGTVAVAYGASSTPSTIYTQYVSGSTSSTAQSVVHLRVPPQWYYELTATGVTLGTPSMVQE